jgi:hypothetical protein
MAEDQIKETKTSSETERKRRKVRAGSTSEIRLKSDYFNPYITDDSYEYRLVNDDDEYRITTLEDNDWDKVLDNKNKVLRQPCGTLKDGRTQHRFLMRKKKEWYEADQKEKLAPLDEIERELLRGQGKEGFGNNKVEADKFYVPKDSKNRVEYK